MQVTETSKCPLGISDLSTVWGHRLDWNCLKSRCRYYKDSTCSKKAKPKEAPAKFGLTKRVKVKM